jgi:WD40 repeat protein
VSSVSWSPDGKTLASASWDRTVKLWEAATGKEQATLQGHTSRVFSVSWSPDGKTLASADLGGTVMLWDVSPAR